jgi:hypothetical protein
LFEAVILCEVWRGFLRQTQSKDLHLARRPGQFLLGKPLFTQIDPRGIGLCNQGDLFRASPTLQLLLARNCVAWINKTLEPNQTLQL